MDYFATGLPNNYFFPKILSHFLCTNATIPYLCIPILKMAFDVCLSELE